MKSEMILVGLEIGTTKVCTVVAETQTDGSLRILGVGETPAKGVRKGEIVDFSTAQACIRESISMAEIKSDVEISSVFLGVTGGHISSINNRGLVLIPEGSDGVDEDDIEDVRLNAQDVRLPVENTIVHAISQHYYVDGKAVLDPLGMLCHKIEADFHIIHGIASRINNAVRCVLEIPLEVEDVVFNGLASALVVLDANQRDMGALVIDLGGGTTDYLAYADGVVRASGTLAVGGDHVTNDISMGLRIPINRAERLKLEEGSVVLGNCLPGETIVIKEDTSFAGKEVERESLNKIIHLRMRETLELIRARLQREKCLDFLGAGVVLTGGGSQINGLKHLAEEVFGMPVSIVHARSVAGVTSAFERPEYSTAIGLVRYAQAVQADRHTPSIGGRIAQALGGIFKKLGSKRRHSSTTG